MAATAARPATAIEPPKELAELAPGVKGVIGELTGVGAALLAR